MKSIAKTMKKIAICTALMFWVFGCSQPSNSDSKSTSTGFLEGAGEVVSTGITIDKTTFEKTSEVAIVPAGKEAVIDMKDDSSWNTFVTESAESQWKGVFIKDRKVTLSPFVMGQYEVTQELYEAVLGTDGQCNSTPSFSSNNPAEYEKQELRPVESVTWYDAVYFCNALTKLTMTENDCVYTITDIKRDSYRFIISATVTQDFSKKGYRLPTEAEWEYAARGGNPQAEEWKNAFGKVNTKDDAMIYDGEDYLFKDENLATVGWYRNNSDLKTREVGLKEENSLKLFDMLGNVCEWCWDNNDESETVTEDDHSGSDKYILRGGSFSDYAYNCAVSPRGVGFPAFQGPMCGFRIVRTIE